MQNNSNWSFVVVKWPKVRSGLIFGICRIHDRNQFIHPIYKIGPKLSSIELGSYQFIRQENSNESAECLIIATGNFKTCSIGFNHVCQAYQRHGEYLFDINSPVYYFKCGTRKRKLNN